MYENQYGKSRTAVVLAQLVSESPEPEKTNRKVTRLIRELNDVLSSVDSLNENSCAHSYLYKITFQNFSERAKVLLGEGKVATFTINLMNVRKKQGLEKFTTSKKKTAK
jgi:hypothetical protein